jgi:hypothetical protein
MFRDRSSIAVILLLHTPIRDSGSSGWTWTFSAGTVLAGSSTGIAFWHMESSKATPIQPRASVEPMRLLNHLIRPPQQRRRDRQAEGLGRLEVDDQLELRRLLDGKLARVFALQDPVHVSGSARLEIRGE